jgi:hypothetical protein
MEELGPGLPGARGRHGAAGHEAPDVVNGIPALRVAPDEEC